MWIKIQDDLYNLDHVLQVSISKNKYNPFSPWIIYLYHDKQTKKTGSVTQIEFTKEKEMLFVYENILQKVGCTMFQVSAEDMERFDEMADEFDKDSDDLMDLYEEYSDMDNEKESKETASYDLGKGDSA